MFELVGAWRGMAASSDSPTPAPLAFPIKNKTPAPGTAPNHPKNIGIARFLFHTATNALLMTDAKRLYEHLCKHMTEERVARFEEVLAQRTRHLTLVVEDMFQDHNAAAVVRSCDCFGVQDVHIIEEIYEFKLANSIAKGAEKWVNMHMYSHHEDNMRTCLAKLRQAGYKLVAATPEKSAVEVDELDITNKTALILGAEKTGISDLVRQEADGFVQIPMLGFTESFNVSVSAALILHVLRQKLRRSPEIPWQLTEEEKIELRLAWAMRSIPNGPELADYYKSEA